MVEVPAQTQPKRKGFYMSLRLKLLISLTLLFTAAFAGIFYWFYNFVSDQTWNLIKTDAQNTLTGALEGIDGDQFEALVQEAQPRADGYTDDPRYWEHVEWLYHVHEVEPRAFPKLRFHWDPTPENADHIEKVLAGLRNKEIK